MNTAIHPSAQVDPLAVLGPNVKVGPNTIIGPGVSIGANCFLANNVTITGRVEMGANNVVHTGAVIGTPPQDRGTSADIDSLVRIGQGNVLREYVTVHRATKPGEATVIGDNNMLMANVHIAHDCRLGNNINIANATALAGFVEVGDGAFISGLCAVHQFCRIGSTVMLGGCSKVRQDIVPFALADGQPAAIYGINAIGMRRQSIDGETRKAVRKAFKYIFFAGLNTRQALAKIEAELFHIPECRQLVDFIKESKRGISRKSEREEN